MIDAKAIENGDFNTFLRVIADVLMEIGPDDVIVKLTGDCIDLIGHDFKVGDEFTKCLHPKDVHLFSLVKNKLAKNRKMGPAPFRVIKENGQEGAVEIYAVSLRRSGQMYIQLMLRPYQGGLVLPTASSRPSSSQHREFTKGNFSKLSKRLKEYAAGLKVSDADALMKLAGVGASTTEPLEAQLWTLCRLLNDAAKEGTEAKTEKVSAPKTAAKPDLQASLDSALKMGTNLLRTDSVTGDDGLSEADAIKASVFSLQQASKGGKSGSMAGVSGDYEKRLAKTKAQLRAFKAIVTQEHFEIALQPIINIETEELHHYEALCRFDPKVYDGSPFHFMCFAEEIGVIHEFDLVMVLKVIHMIKRLKGIGYNISVAVNISGKSIQSPIFLRHFFRVLEDCGDIRKNLIFELTESSQIDDLEGTNKILSRIREFGHKVCLDDFGAGAAGLQYLRALKVDCVKIDGIYIRKGIEKEENRSFLRSMADLCKQLDIETVGECVEDEVQLEFLRDIGITYAQGWYYGKPVPVEEALENL